MLCYMKLCQIDLPHSHSFSLLSLNLMAITLHYVFFTRTDNRVGNTVCGEIVLPDVLLAFKHKSTIEMFVDGFVIDGIDMGIWMINYVLQHC